MRGLPVRVALLRDPGPDLPRPRARVRRGHGRVLPERGPVQPLRVLRAHERQRVCADRLPLGGVRPAPGGADLRGLQHGRGRLHPLRDRDPLRAHRRAEPGPDRRRPVPRARRRAGGGGVRVSVHRVHGQGGGGAVPLLARRRLRGGAHAGLRDLLGRDERPGHLRDRPGLLDHVRRAVPRPPGDAPARLPPLRRRDRAVGSGAVPGPAPPQAPARLRDHQPDRDGADRGGPVQHRGHRRRGAAHRRRRAAARGAVRGHRGRHPPHRQRQRAAARTASGARCRGCWR